MSDMQVEIEEMVKTGKKPETVDDSLRGYLRDYTMAIIVSLVVWWWLFLIIAVLLAIIADNILTVIIIVAIPVCSILNIFLLWGLDIILGILIKRRKKR